MSPGPTCPPGYNSTRQTSQSIKVTAATKWLLILSSPPLCLPASFVGRPTALFVFSPATNIKVFAQLKPEPPAVIRNKLNWYREDEGEGTNGKRVTFTIRR